MFGVHLSYHNKRLLTYLLNYLLLYKGKYSAPDALLCRRSLPVVDTLRRPLLDTLIRRILPVWSDALDADAPDAFYQRPIFEGSLAVLKRGKKSIREIL